MKVPPKILKHQVKPAYAKAEESSVDAKPMPIANPQNKPIPASVPKPDWTPENKTKPVTTARIQLKPAPAIEPEPVIEPASDEETDVIVDNPDPLVEQEPVTEETPTPEPEAEPAIEEEIEEEAVAEPVAATPRSASAYVKSAAGIKPSKPRRPASVGKPAAKKPIARAAGKPIRNAQDGPTASREAALAQRIVQETHIQKTSESLPVLEAFQEFLDSEQRRMRSRMVAISTFFTIVILLLVGGGAAAAYYILNPMKKNMESIRGVITQLEENSNKNSTSTSETINQLNMMIAKERKELIDNAASIESKVSVYGDDLTLMRDNVMKLQNENTELKSQLSTIKKDLPDVTYKVASLMNEIDRLKTQRQQSPPPRAPKTAQETKRPVPAVPTATPEVTMDAPAAPSAKPAKKSFSAMISFVPKGKEERVLCLLPIPE